MLDKYNKNKVLLIDVGNTNIIINSFRFTTNKSATIDDFALNLKFATESLEIKDALISSVVPELNKVISLAIKKYFNINPKFVSGLNLDLAINYANPEEIGSDRLVNAIAAIQLYDAPCMVVDIGTAATIDIINEHKEYIGGVILPGIGMTINALSALTSKLPKIDFKKPDHLIAGNTKENIQSGIYYGFLGSIIYFKKQLGNPRVILTGGYTAIFAEEKAVFEVADQDLTIKGLELIYQNI
ncbi:MAG: type III pantothenate kinase [bacterium]|nr:type III pantothenate kinase [bacterium]